MLVQQDAQAALVRYNSFEKFTISSKPVTADYIHAGVFVPVLGSSANMERFSFNPLGSTATKLVYWDEEAWASELVVSTGSPKLASIESQSRSAADVAAAAAEKEGLLKSGKEAQAKAKKRKTEAAPPDKQKKVDLSNISLSIRRMRLTLADRASAFTILEQSPR